MSRLVVSEAGKKLLKHSIISTNSANKRIEENLMWETWQKRKRDKSTESSPKQSTKRHRSDDDCDYILRDSDKSSSGSDVSKRSDKNYWTKKLLKAEENDTGRWNHNGFKELYPEEFHSDSTSQSSSIESIKKKEKKKKKFKKIKSSKKKKKKDKKKKKKKHKSKHSN